MNIEIPKEIIKVVKGGMNSSFWVNGLKKVLEDYIRILTDKITGDIPMTEGEKRDDLLLERRAYKNLLTLPEKILEDSKIESLDKKPTGIPNDPYDDE